MSNRPDTAGAEHARVVTASPETLREWELPEPEGDKNSRGRVVVVGGSRSAPGAVLLAGIAALRVGAGRLSIVAPESVAVPLGIAAPESGVTTFDARGRLGADAASEVRGADAVLVGPGLDDPRLTARLLHEVDAARTESAPLVLDAFALGVLPGLGRRRPRAPLVLNPNLDETARLLGREIGHLPDDVVAIARRYGAVVSSHACVGAPDGRAWLIPGSGPGLGTSGSGDVLAGAITGFAARGVDLPGAAVWAAFAHASAGAVLGERVGRLGYLARELRDDLPSAITALSRRAR